MRTLRFKGLLTPNGWVENATIRLDHTGKITAYDSVNSRNYEYINGYALPGFQNAHSHAFQYAMAGMSENHSLTESMDDFWGWRNNMYNLALKISPKQLQNVATMLYAEMVRNGYTSVAEFHYLHHSQNGKPYDSLSEMGERLLTAAEIAGIKITLIPMFYQKGGFAKDAEEEQRRFLSKNIHTYLQLLEETESAIKNYKNSKLGIGVHSLRAVELEQVKELCSLSKGDLPFHLHIAEQIKEVEDCLNHTGYRPVEWLHEHVDLNENYNLVHATHMVPEEIKKLAQSKVNVVLCPTTEGNLADGRFPFPQYHDLQGRWSLGSDSHICLNPLEEIRMLDYGQRNFNNKRETFRNSQGGDNGTQAIKKAWLNGRAAMGALEDTFFSEGQAFDAVVYDANAPLLACASFENLTNTIVYASDPTHILGTMINGEWISRGTHHRNHHQILVNFKKTMAELWS